jgi:hypothetical protein
MPKSSTKKMLNPLLLAGIESFFSQNKVREKVCNSGLFCFFASDKLNRVTQCVNTLSRTHGGWAREVMAIL